MTMRASIGYIEGLGSNTGFLFDMVVVKFAQYRLFAAGTLFIKLFLFAFLYQMLIEEFHLNTLIALLTNRNQGAVLEQVNVSEIIIFKPFVL